MAVRINIPETEWSCKLSCILLESERILKIRHGLEISSMVSSLLQGKTDAGLLGEKKGFGISAA
jgi:hypothetical protein